MQMSEKKHAPKYIQLMDEIRSSIENGELRPGMSVGTETFFREKYQLSSTTVIRALNELVKEGLLYRIQGKGTYVTERTYSIKADQLIGLLVRSQGHIYETFMKTLIARFQANGFHSIVIDTSDAKENREMILARFRELLGTRPAGILLDGDYQFPYDYLESIQDQIHNLTFSIKNESSFDFNANQILSDDEYGGYIVVKHLLSMNHSKILFLTPASWVLKINSTASRILAGCQKALRENAIDWSCQSVFSIENDGYIDQQKFAEILTSANRPDAIFAIGDFLAKQAMDITKRLNLKIPEDIPLVGYFNTPWASLLEVPLTSVSIKENEIANRSADILIDSIHDKTRLKEKVIIKPELIIRKSCGGLLTEGSKDEEQKNMCIQ